jgi:hypothetical protein
VDLNEKARVATIDLIFKATRETSHHLRAIDVIRIQLKARSGSIFRLPGAHLDAQFLM